LFSSLALLQFDVPSYFTPTYLQAQVLALVRKNNHEKLARIRLTVYRGDGGLYDPQNLLPNYLIQTWELNPANNKLNENGLIIGIFEDAKKSQDKYSSIKSNNYLGYAMAAIWVKQQRLNDAILLNNHNRIADATIANVFIVKNGLVKTPTLGEGGINGVMRRHLLHTLPTIGIDIEETTLTIGNLLEADELFLTNSIYGIRWVKEFRGKRYGNAMAARIFKEIISSK
jgi:branched-chain amino acid aminotransferase